MSTLAESLGSLGPWLFLALFFASSFLLICRLEAMSKRGIEGTVLGTLIMPYCSGTGNLVFAFVLATSGGPGGEVVTNSIVNNVTNLTLILGLPALFWGLNIAPARKQNQNANAEAFHRTHRALLLTMSAVLIFTGTLWIVARNGKIDRPEGIVLVGLFFCWQGFHMVNLIKRERKKKNQFRWTLLLDLTFLAIGAYGTYVSVERLVHWLSTIHSGFISAQYMGWLSGWLMVMPNGLLAIYYGWKRQSDITYTSQIGDNHISIPLCIGIYALYRPIKPPALFDTGILIILGATLIHFSFVMWLGRLPRFMGAMFVALYGVFLYKGLL